MNVLAAKMIALTVVLAGCVENQESAGPVGVEAALAAPEVPIMRSCVTDAAVRLDDGRSAPEQIAVAAAAKCQPEINAVKSLVDGWGRTSQRVFREELDKSMIELGMMAVLEAR